MGFGERPKALGTLLKGCQYSGSIRASLGVGLMIFRQRGKKNMRDLVDIRGTKACAILRIVAPARFIVWLGHRNLTLNNSTHESFVVGLAPAGLITDRLRREAEVFRALQKQFSNHQRPCRLMPGSN